MRLIYLFGFLFFYIFLFYFIFTGKTSLFSQINQTNSIEQLSNDPLKGEYSKVREFDIEMDNFVFSKRILNVNYGEKVRIRLINLEGFHDFAIDEFRIKSDILTINETQYLEFIATKKGQFEYYSSVSDDRAKGMRGTLYIN